MDEPYQAPLLQWDSFKPTGGAYDSSWVGPSSSAAIEAAKMMANPITRAFEQMMSRRFEQEQLGKEMEFRAGESQRDRENRTMLNREQDAAALARVEAEIRAREAADAAERDRAAAAAIALRDLSQPTLGAMGDGGGYMPGSTVAPGTGALPWDAGAFMPAAPPAGLPQYPAIPDEAARVLGPTGVGTVLSNRAGATERAQSNLEQARKAEAAAQAARQAYIAFTQGVMADESLTPEDKVRLTQRAQADDLAGANEEREMILAEKRDEARKKAESDIKKAADKERGFFSHKFPGMGEADIPIAVRDLPKQGITDPDQMPAPVANALWMAAQASIASDRSLMGTLIQADAAGMFKDGDPNKGVAANAIRLRANEMAQQFGWQRQKGLNDQGAIVAPPAPASPLPPADLYASLISVYGREPTKDEYLRARERVKAGLPATEEAQVPAPGPMGPGAPSKPTPPWNQPVATGSEFAGAGSEEERAARAALQRGLPAPAPVQSAPSQYGDGKGMWDNIVRLGEEARAASKRTIVSEAELRKGMKGAPGGRVPDPSAAEAMQRFQQAIDMWEKKNGKLDLAQRRKLGLEPQK